MQNLHNFYVFIDIKNDDTDFEFEITINRDLYVGDIIDFSSYDLANKLEDKYKTPLFTIITRQFSIQNNIMYLHLEPFLV